MTSSSFDASASLRRDAGFDEEAPLASSTLLVADDAAPTASTAILTSGPGDCWKLRATSGDVDNDFVSFAAFTSVRTSVSSLAGPTSAASTTLLQHRQLRD